MPLISLSFLGVYDCALPIAKVVGVKVYLSRSETNLKPCSKCMQLPHDWPLISQAGSAITNGREPRSCLGQVFNSKLGCFATPGRKWIV
jgi:hypothetical protein